MEPKKKKEIDSVDWFEKFSASVQEEAEAKKKRLREKQLSAMSQLEAVLYGENFKKDNQAVCMVAFSDALDIFCGSDPVTSFDPEASEEAKDFFFGLRDSFVEAAEKMRGFYSEKEIVEILAKFAEFLCGEPYCDESRSYLLDVIRHVMKAIENSDLVVS